MEKKKLDNTEINRLKAVVGIDPAVSGKDGDEIRMLEDALKKIDKEKKKLKSMVSSSSASPPQPNPVEVKQPLTSPQEHQNAAPIPSVPAEKDVKSVDKPSEVKVETKAQLSSSKEQIAAVGRSAENLINKLKESGKFVSKTSDYGAGATSSPRVEIKKQEKDLFVKIDEHREIAEQLITARDAIKEIAETVELLAKAESIKEEAIKRLEESAEKIDRAWKRSLELLEEGNKTYPEEFDEQRLTGGDELYQLKVELDRLRKILERIR